MSPLGAVAIATAALLAATGCSTTANQAPAAPIAPPAQPTAAGAGAVSPIATVRVAFDRAGVTASEAHGLADLASGRAVTVDDPVRIASISKLLVAIGVMRLVEQGKLDLDADASTYLGYRLRNPAFPDTPVTLRMLLSHRSSLTDAAGYYQVPLDGAVRDLLKNPNAWDSTHAPGSWFAYTNLNFPVIAEAMERITGERFDLLMQRLVLKPMRINGCFNWSSCEPSRTARAVVLYDRAHAPVRDDNQGRAPDCAVVPASDGSCDLGKWKAGRNGATFAPQGGMRISGNDLARLGRLLLNDGELDGVRVISARSLNTLVGPEWTYDGNNGVTGEGDDGGSICRYGLAVMTLATPVKGCRDDLFGDGINRVGHSGSAYGLQSGLWVDRKAGTGVAFFATGMEGAAQGQHSVQTRVEEQLAGGEPVRVGEPRGVSEEE